MTEIAIQNLSKTIKSNAVIQDISMNLKSGVIYGFKGINGSGKTMLMRWKIPLFWIAIPDFKT